jgi:outer membrane immunogenic protein
LISGFEQTMRSLLISICVIAVCSVGGAGAADLPVRTQAPAPSATFSWTGCYIGGYVGAAWQSRDVNAWGAQSTGGTIPVGTFYQSSGQRQGADDFTNGNFNYNMGGGPAIGGALGCNWQPTTLLLFGVEGEGGYMRVHASSIDPYSYAHAADTVSYTRIGKWETDLAGRAGLVLWDRVLLYVKGGVGFHQNRVVADRYLCCRTVRPRNARCDRQILLPFLGWWSRHRICLVQ